MMLSFFFVFKSTFCVVLIFLGIYWFHIAVVWLIFCGGVCCVWCFSLSTYVNNPLVENLLETLFVFFLLAVL